MTAPSSSFKSIFKINGKPILPPLITDEVRKEIQEIREKCRAKEEKLKIQKDLANEAKKNDLMRSRSDSYTLSSPIFAADQLPEVLNSAQEEHPEKDNESHKSLESSIVEDLIHDDNVIESEKEEPEKDQLEKEEAADGTEKGQIQEVEQEHKDEADIQPQKEGVTQDEIAQPNQSTFDEGSIPPAQDNHYDLYQPQLKSQIQDLIKKQKEEYLVTMNILKQKFLSEQQQLLHNLQTSMQAMTSTPLQNVSIAPTEDEEFTEFQTALQSANLEAETTLVDEEAAREKAATTINAYARGYLVRRLLKTIHVEECIKNIHDTLQLILSLKSHKADEIQDLLFKTRLFKQLQSDLYRLYDIFFGLSTREKMMIISKDRERRLKKLTEKSQFNSSLHAVTL